MYQNSGVCVDAYAVTDEDKSMYYGQIQEIWELDFHSFKIPLSRCNWVDANKGVVKDKDGFISIDRIEVRAFHVSKNTSLKCSVF
jgi:hypothetical protein